MSLTLCGTERCRKVAFYGNRRKTVSYAPAVLVYKVLCNDAPTCYMLSRTSYDSSAVNEQSGCSLAFETSVLWHKNKNGALLRIDGS